MLTEELQFRLSNMFSFINKNVVQTGLDFLDSLVSNSRLLSFSYLIKGLKQYTLTGPIFDNA